MAGDFRSWLWQTCNEFGFFESTDSNLTTNNFVGPDIPVDYYIQQCVDVFGDAFSNSTIFSNIAKTNAYYTSQNYNATRVVAPNGSNDPWHVLGIRHNHNPQLYAFTIAGAGHCADMYPSAPSDVPGLTFVKNEIRYLVLEWIYDNKY
uniref:Serine protease K12H4.7 n=1 Tax=Panagrellus redivivus TaxID=6233 RepID=A0A7E4VNK1_PANRE